jgi:hypothetical protein
MERKGGIMLRKASLLLIPVLLISLLVSLACISDENGPDPEEQTTAESITPFKLVPQRANMLGQIDLARILGDKDVAELYNNALPKEDAEALQIFDEVLSPVGWDSGRGVLFGDISNMSGEEGYLGAIVSGIRDKEGLITLIKSMADEPLMTISYKGYKITTDSSKEAGLVFFGKDQMAIGSMQAIKDVLEVKDGEQPSIEGILLDKYNNLGGVLIGLAAAIPPGTLEKRLQQLEDEIPTESGDEEKDTNAINPIFPILKDMETATLTLDKKEQSLSLNMQLCFAEADSAEDAKGFIDLMMQMAMSGPEEIPEDQQALVSALKDIKVDLNGSCVDISIELPISVVKDLIKNADPVEK